MNSDSSLISPALTEMLHEGEEIEFIERPLEAAYRRSMSVYLGFAFLLIFLLDGYLWNAGMLVKDTWYLTLLVIILWNIPALLLLGAGIRIYLRSQKAFYAYTNMRIIFTTLNASNTLDFVHFRDIHHLDVSEHLVTINVKNVVEYSKKMRHIHGVRDPKKFETEIDEKLEPFRLGHH